MHLRQKLNNVLTGAIAGMVVPLIAFTLFFLFTRHGLSLPGYFSKIEAAGNISEIMSVCVFANIIIFLIFNRFEMLRASKGVLGITIAWAFTVFGIKLF
ncbi:MAG TPA: hypothetical protein DIS74_07150 [Bacteroidales bacterium]|jgi:hypothetical protein|nr:hypothetical protein [Bacteroidales bacterium]